MHPDRNRLPGQPTAQLRSPVAERQAPGQTGMRP